MKSYRKEIAKQWAVDGKCPNCGARPPAPDRKLCEKCLDVQLQASRRSRVKNPSVFRNQYHTRKEAGLCVVCGVPGKPRTSRSLVCEDCAKYERQRSVRIKYQVMWKYGGVCFCCGETAIAFLTLDHIRGDGAKLRNSGVHTGGGHFYKKLLKLPIDPNLRVACYNCNCGRRSTGTCPHKDSSFFEEALTHKRWDRRSNIGATIPTSIGAQLSFDFRAPRSKTRRTKKDD